MDSNALERERGITIYAKNASVPYKGTKINIVDTPGHADFGSEVERVLRSIDSVLLVVDAQEGPMPQTRFVLKKSLELGLKPIVIINKIDKPAADPARTEEQVLELFLELGASDAQADFPIVYAIGRQGIAKLKLTDESTDLTPLLETILKHVPSVSAEASDKPARLQPFNLGYDNFLGRLAIAHPVDQKTRLAQAGAQAVTQQGVVFSKEDAHGQVFSSEGFNRRHGQRRARAPQRHRPDRLLTVRFATAATKSPAPPPASARPRCARRCARRLSVYRPCARRPWRRPGSRGARER
jgi:GTP-binding protein TypA/BipA